MTHSPRLSIHDGFAFALAEINSGCILLTGDNRLRRLATAHSIEVHGLLWILDRMHEHKLRPAAALLVAIRTLESDPAGGFPRAIWLPASGDRAACVESRRLPA